MTSARDRIDEVRSPVEPPRHLASWYAPGISDGLGDRLLMFDNTNAPSWELLRFRPEFAAAPGFEASLRERVAQLAGFDHPSFPAVRAVENLGPRNGLALVSRHVAGRHLSQALERPRGPAAAMRLVQQLLPPLADLQRQGDGFAHGALKAERIVLTTEGRFMIREHVLGSALQCLSLSATRLWVDLGVVAGKSGDAAPRLGCRSDVIQLGLIALSLMLGRRVDASEYPDKVENLLEQVARTTGRWSPVVFVPLRRWLEQALQLTDSPFASAQEANDGLGEWREKPQSVADCELPGFDSQDGFGLERTAGSRPTTASVGGSPVSSPLTATAADVTESIDWNADATDRVAPSSIPSDGSRVRPLGLFSATRSPNRERPGDEAARRPETNPFEDRRVWESSRAAEEPDDVPVDSHVVGQSRALRLVAAVAFLVASGEAVLIGYLLYGRALAPPTDTAVVVDSLEPGSKVFVNGLSMGVTPLHLRVGSQTQSIRVQTPEAKAKSPEATTRSNVRADQIEPAGGGDQHRPQTRPNTRVLNTPQVAAQLKRAGGITLLSAIELNVFENGQLLGSSREDSITATAGRHEFDLVNSELGYRSRRVVDIREGEVVSLQVTPANGSVSINAFPWAEVWIDGNSVGETPLAKVSVPLGEHEFIFRHPQLGEQRQRAVVRSGAVTLVNATLQP
jgi:hypothetical protein